MCRCLGIKNLVGKVIPPAPRAFNNFERFHIYRVALLTFISILAQPSAQGMPIETWFALIKAVFALLTRTAVHDISGMNMSQAAVQNKSWTATWAAVPNMSPTAAQNIPGMNACAEQVTNIWMNGCAEQVTNWCKTAAWTGAQTSVYIMSQMAVKNICGMNTFVWSHSPYVGSVMFIQPVAHSHVQVCWHSDDDFTPNATHSS